MSKSIRERCRFSAVLVLGVAAGASSMVTSDAAWAQPYGYQGLNQVGAMGRDAWSSFVQSNQTLRSDVARLQQSARDTQRSLWPGRNYPAFSTHQYRGSWETSTFRSVVPTRGMANSWAAPSRASVRRSFLGRLFGRR